MALNCVKTPKEMEPLFTKAEKYVKDYFSKEKRDPSTGSITIGGQRYILVRAKAMSVDFLEFIENKYPGLDEEDAFEAAAKLLFDMAHATGKSDAQNFHKAMNVKDPIAKLSSGPVHFAYTGWAFVDIFAESKPQPDDNYYLIYDHPHSFEADSWITAKKKTKNPVCIMNAGYSSGWCEESFGVKLVSKEILCRARGDKYCRFIMAPENKVDGYIAEYKKANPALFKKKK